MAKLVKVPSEEQPTSPETKVPEAKSIDNTYISCGKTHTFKGETKGSPYSAYGTIEHTDCHDYPPLHSVENGHAVPGHDYPGYGKIVENDSESGPTVYKDGRKHPANDAAVHIKVAKATHLNPFIAPTGYLTGLPTLCSIVENHNLEHDKPTPRGILGLNFVVFTGKTSTRTPKVPKGEKHTLSPTHNTVPGSHNKGPDGLLVHERSLKDCEAAVKHEKDKPRIPCPIPLVTGDSTISP